MLAVLVTVPTTHCYAELASSWNRQPERPMQRATISSQRGRCNARRSPARLEPTARQADATRDNLQPEWNRQPERLIQRIFWFFRLQGKITDAPTIHLDATPFGLGAPLSTIPIFALNALFVATSQSILS